MDVPLPLTQGTSPAHAGTANSRVEIPQYSRRAILIVWAAAALPMGALAWLVAPALQDHLAGNGPVPIAKALILCLTAGLVWQFGLVAILVRREQQNLRWPTICDALWLHAPRSPRTGRTGGKVWLILIPLIAAFGAEELIPTLPHPSGRDLDTFFGTHAGQTFMHGAWGWYGLLLVLFAFNTVLGEELLFRGFLLPRMNGAFGAHDWVWNGLLFAGYHLHRPWVIPSALLDMFILAYPTKRYQSAWIGIAVHSAQSIVFAAIGLTLVI